MGVATAGTKRAYHRRRKITPPDGALAREIAEHLHRDAGVAEVSAVVIADVVPEAVQRIEARAKHGREAQGKQVIRVWDAFAPLLDEELQFLKTTEMRGPDLLEHFALIGSAALLARAKSGDTRAAIYLVDRCLGTPQPQRPPEREELMARCEADTAENLTLQQVFEESFCYGQQGGA